MPKVEIAAPEQTINYMSFQHSHISISIHQGFFTGSKQCGVSILICEPILQFFFLSEEIDKHCEVEPFQAILYRFLQHCIDNWK